MASEKRAQFPPTPPDTDDSQSTSSDALCSSAESNADIEFTSEAQDCLFPLPPISQRPLQVLAQDQATPDNHVPRDPRLIRLTGVHPFNVEAPLSALYDEGFLTSAELFYVRNHGAVPHVDDSEILDWEFSVSGMVQNPITISMRELLSEFEQITVPISLVCAGNRRKEQNVVRKTKGFSWGAAGVSTALWTGVTMADVIRKAQPLRGARYVCMEGADKLPNGYYGTSVKLNWVLDPNRGIMLAHKMNGDLLPPDHGRPLRAVIPGQIGGRSVKWLKKLIVTAEPSDNWYHIWDNRVLPTMVSPEQSASEPHWWKDDRYAIYDLSTNSAIAYPAHEEHLSLVAPPERYCVKGYAYGGGGRRITRVEVTLDQGKTWSLANIKYHEDAYRDLRVSDGQMLFGGRLDMSWRETCFCWCFWEIDLDVAAIRNAKDIMARAMDESMNVQPRDMYWSVLGMMNNPWFRVVVHQDGDGLRFEHPTQPALIPGGWMERVKQTGGDLTNGRWGERASGEEEVVEVEKPKEIKMTKDGVDRAINIDEFKKHDGADEPWFVLNGEVYDGTKFLEGHPGGAASIVGAAGQDATDEFMAIHSETAKAMMVDYHIGSLDKAGRAALADPSDASPESNVLRPVFLQSKVWTKGILSAKTVISSDTRIFHFTLEHPDQDIGLPTGQHLMLRLRDPVTNEAIIRSYTPLSKESDKGKLDVLIKVYFDTPERKGGKMTQALDKLPLNQPVEFKGPIGKFEYLGRGECTLLSVKRHVKKFIMICGGSGITPVFQVLRAVLQDRDDPTDCLLLDGNRVADDILCRADIDALAAGNAHRCRIVHTLTNPPATWPGLTGRIGAPLLEKEVGRYATDTYAPGERLVLICGPSPMEKAVHVALNELGWADTDLLFF